MEKLIKKIFNGEEVTISGGDEILNIRQVDGRNKNEKKYEFIVQTTDGTYRFSYFSKKKVINHLERWFMRIDKRNQKNLGVK